MRTVRRHPETDRKEGERDAERVAARSSDGPGPFVGARRRQVSVGGPARSDESRCNPASAVPRDLGFPASRPRPAPLVGVETACRTPARVVTAAREVTPRAGAVCAADRTSREGCCVAKGTSRERTRDTGGRSRGQPRVMPFETRRARQRARPSRRSPLGSTRQRRTGPCATRREAHEGTPARRHRPCATEANAPTLRHPERQPETVKATRGAAKAHEPRQCRKRSPRDGLTPRG